jgi:predicted dehydrogenase
MRFLIAGYGSIGRRHMRNLLALGEKDIVLYRTKHSTLPEDELQGFPVETDLEAALAHKPKAVIIANPTALHLDVAIPAAKAGCHVLMEKPISSTLNNVDILKDALLTSGVQLLMGFQFRFHPGLQRIINELKDGAIGRPLSFRADWGEYLPGWHPWEDYTKSYSARSDLGGGVTLTLCHPLDYMRWIFGEVKEVWGTTAKLSDLEIQVEDVAEIGLRFESGVIGSVHLNYYQQPPVHRLEIVGTEGTLRWDNADGAVYEYRRGAHDWEVFPAPEGFERNELFLEELRHFMDVCNGYVRPACTLEDGKRSLEIIQAVYQSSKEKRTIEI